MTNAEKNISFAFVACRDNTEATTTTCSWNELAEILTMSPSDHGTLALAAYQVANAEVKATEKDGVGWLPVTLIPGGKRCRQHVVTITALVLDFDKGTSRQHIEASLAPYEYVLHSTYGYSPEMPRFRVVLPLSDPIKPALVEGLFDHFNSMFDNMLDRSCGHDSARFYYFGRCPPDAVEYFVGVRHEGALLDAVEVMTVAMSVTRPAAVATCTETIGSSTSSAANGRPDFRRGYGDGDRTEALATRAGSCLASGMTVAQATAKCLDWNEHNMPPLEPEKVLATVTSISTTVARRREQAIVAYDKQIDLMNEKYVWVGDKSTVFRLEHNDFATPADIRNTYGNRVVDVGEGIQTGQRPLGDAWLKSPARREVKRVVYEPGKPRLHDDCLNLWIGWGCEPKEGSVALWTAYLEKMFAGDAAATKWFEQWCSYPLQHPGVKLASAVVLWSAEQGVGKTLLAQSLGRLYGDANFRTITAAELHGNFNSWAKGCQFVLGEENASSDQRADANALKHLVTGRTITINEKHQPTYEQRNAINFLFTSNHPDAFHLEMHDRRFFVWEVTCGKLPASVYHEFAGWLDDGGAEALMYHLQRLDLAGFDPNAEAPVTEAKRRMIDMSRSELERWLDDISTPQAMKATFGKEIVSAEDLAREYQRSFGARVSTTAVGKALVRLGLPVKDRRKVSLPCGRRVHVQALTRREHWVAQDNAAWVIDYERRAPPGISAVH